MLALVRRFCQRHGGYLRILETTAERAVIEYHRPPEPEPRRVTYTIDEARQAGLLSRDAWRQFPVDMLRNRAVSRACREGFPDVLLGLYDPEEIEAIEIPATTHDTGQTIPSNQPSAEEAAAANNGESGPDGERERLMRSLHAAIRGRGDHSTLPDLATSVFGVSSLAECSIDQLHLLHRACNECRTRETLEELRQLAAGLTSAADRVELNAAVAEIRQRAFSGARRQLLQAAYLRVAPNIPNAPSTVETADNNDSSEGDMDATQSNAAAGQLEPITSWAELWRRLEPIYGIRGMSEAAEFLDEPFSAIRGMTPQELHDRISARGARS